MCVCVGGGKGQGQEVLEGGGGGVGSIHQNLPKAADEEKAASKTTTLSVPLPHPSLTITDITRAGSWGPRDREGWDGECLNPWESMNTTASEMERMSVLRTVGERDRLSVK